MGGPAAARERAQGGGGARGRRHRARDRDREGTLAITSAGSGRLMRARPGPAAAASVRSCRTASRSPRNSPKEEPGESIAPAPATVRAGCRPPEAALEAALCPAPIVSRSPRAASPGPWLAQLPRRAPPSAHGGGRGGRRAGLRESHPALSAVYGARHAAASGAAHATESRALSGKARCWAPSASAGGAPRARIDWERAASIRCANPAPRKSSFHRPPRPTPVATTGWRRAAPSRAPPRSAAEEETGCAWPSRGGVAMDGASKLSIALRRSSRKLRRSCEPTPAPQPATRDTAGVTLRGALPAPWGPTAAGSGRPYLQSADGTAPVDHFEVARAAWESAVFTRERVPPVLAKDPFSGTGGHAGLRTIVRDTSAAPHYLWTDNGPGLFVRRALRETRRDVRFGDAHDPDEGPTPLLEISGTCSNKNKEQSRPSPLSEKS